MITKYFSQGLMSLKEGMTFTTNTYDDDGNFLGGVRDPIGSFFKCKEITKEEYDKYMGMMNDPNVPKGMAGGILNEKGVEDAKRFLAQKRQDRINANNDKINLSVKKIKKLLQLGVIEEGDIDTEIEQQNMLEFKDEIKKRLETN